VAGVIRECTACAVAAYRAVDEPRIVRAQRRVAETEPLHHAGTEALDQHIRLRRQRAQHMASRSGFEVQPRLALAAIHEPVKRAWPPRDAIGGRLHHRAGRVARAGRFDLQHVGAQFGEPQRCHRARQQTRQVEHTQSLQRGRRGSAGSG
jgi:hypothetical protein